MPDYELVVEMVSNDRLGVVGFDEEVIVKRLFGGHIDDDARKRARKYSEEVQRLFRRSRAKIFLTRKAHKFGMPVNIPISL